MTSPWSLTFLILNTVCRQQNSVGKEHTEVSLKPAAVYTDSWSTNAVSHSGLRYLCRYPCLQSMAVTGKMLFGQVALRTNCRWTYAT